MKLTANQALQLIENFRGKNENDRWIDHCVSVGNTAGKIAGALKDKSYNIDVDKTIALGYVHDIGKYTDKTHKHDIKGYEYLIGKGYDEDYCNICLTHSYLNNDITCTAGGVPDITENPFLTNFVKNHEYTIEEKIINLIFRDDRKNHTQLIIVENTYADKTVDTEKIFEKGISGKENHTGLGLWKVRKIVNKNQNVVLRTIKDDKFFKQQLEIYY